jgi:serine/threonine protein phosphatase PrpC
MSIAISRAMYPTTHHPPHTHRKLLASPAADRGAAWGGGHVCGSGDYGFKAKEFTGGKNSGLIAGTDEPRMFVVVPLEGPSHQLLCALVVVAFVRAEPYVTTLTLQPNKHKFCIIACDGVRPGPFPRARCCSAECSRNARVVGVVQTLFLLSVQLWDVITADEAVAFIAKEQAKEDSDAEDAAKALVEAAYKKGSTDNITVLVIYFHWDRQQQQ